MEIIKNNGLRMVVAGSRTIGHYPIVADIIEDAIDQFGISPSTIISGHARGVDSLAEKWAKQNGVKVELHPADWDRYGKAAGHIRNKEMAKCADCLVAVKDAAAKNIGTGIMIMEARRVGIAGLVYEVSLTAERVDEFGELP